MAISIEAQHWLLENEICLLPWQARWWEAQEQGRYPIMIGGLAVGKTYVLNTYEAFQEAQQRCR